MANAVLVTDKDKFLENKYTMSEFFMIIDGETHEIPVERIHSFKIENYYLEAIFPIFKVVISLESARYYAMIKNKDKVKFKIRIQTYSHNVDTPSEHSMNRDLINDTFVFFPEASGDDLERELKKEAGTLDDNDVLDQINDGIELFLFKDGVVNNLRKQVNYVLSDLNLATATLFLLHNAGVKNLIMAPLDNTDSYSEIILPPLSIDNQIRYLDTNYGFYKDGMIFFIGLTNSYLIPYNGKCAGYKKNEWKETVIYVFEKNNVQSAASNSIKKSNEERFYINLPSDSLDINNDTVTENVISGTDAIMVNTQKNSSSNITIDAPTIGGKTKKTIYNELSNPFTETMYRNLEQSNSVTMTFALQNINIEAFEPNKAVSMIFESPTLNKKYKGEYVVVSAIHAFTGSSEMYECYSVISLKKL